MRPAAVSPSPVGTAVFPWGCIGEHAHTRRADKTIIRRTIVDTGVKYTPPPRDVVLTWQPVPQSETEFEMVWPDDQVEGVASLRVLGDDLRTRPPSTRDDPRLAHLDEAIDGLLAIVQGLHERGCRIGLLQPGNVLVSSHSPPRVVLPDLGFVWKEDDLLVPEWLRSPLAPLWDEKPERQQLPQPLGQPIDPRPETATLARLINCVLTGRIQKDVTPPAADPARPVRRSSAWHRLWTLLGQVSRQEGSVSVDDLRQRLAEIKLSSHYGLTRPRAWLPVVVSVVLLLALGVGGAFWSGWLDFRNLPWANKTGPKDNSRDPATNNPTNDPRLVKFQAALDRLKKEFEAASPLRRSQIVVEIHEAAPSQEVARLETDALREAILENWRDRSRLAANALNREQGLQNYQTLQDLRQELEDHLKRMSPLPASEPIGNREQQCLVFIRDMLD